MRQHRRGRSVDLTFESLVITVAVGQSGRKEVAVGSLWLRRSLLSYCHGDETD